MQSVSGSKSPGGTDSVHPLPFDKQRYAIETWRYLRLAIVVLFVGLVVSIAYEHSQVKNCFQPSISAYYYTPVRGYLVGALICIGVCLFCLKGSTEVEDMLLNLAGMLALIVALVPTPDYGTCATLLFTAHDRDVSVANNLRALLAVELITVILLAGFALHARKPISWTDRIGYGGALTVLVIAIFMFFRHKHAFLEGAHQVAAGLMFACIIAVALSNALGYRRRPDAPWPINPYWFVFGAMSASLLIFPIKWITHWGHWLIVLELVLVILFAVLWGFESKELWDEGLRPAPSETG